LTRYFSILTKLGNLWLKARHSKPPVEEKSSLSPMIPKRENESINNE
jgi:hypothetical protein